MRLHVLRVRKVVAIAAFYALAAALEWSLTLKDQSPRVNNEGRSSLRSTVRSISELVYLPSMAERNPRSPRRDLDHHTRQLLVSTSLTGLIVGCITAEVVPRARLGDHSGFYRVVGFSVMLCGTGLRIWSIRTLGPEFDRVIQIRPNHRLVVGGPYRFIRHPAYAGSLLLYTGT